MRPLILPSKATPVGKEPLDLVVLVSGSGTNLQAILDGIERGALRARVRLVVSNKPEAFALTRAKSMNVPTAIISHRDHATREQYDAELVRVVTRAFKGEKPGFVVLAGFMRILTRAFVDAFPRRVVNIHPSLLPAFPGLHAQEQAIAAGVRITGCTVHLVDVGTDTGPILGQVAVPVRDDDDARSLSARILKEEHRLLPTILQWIAEGRLQFVDNRPRFSGITPAFAWAEPEANLP